MGHLSLTLLYRAMYWYFGGGDPKLLILKET